MRDGKVAVVKRLPWAGLLALAALGTTAQGAPPDDAQSAARQELVAVLRVKPDPDHGAQLFAICTGCHGSQGSGMPSGWVPDIAGQHPHVIAKQLVDYRHGQRWDDRMEKVAGGGHVLKTTQDIADVVGYIGALMPALATSVGNGQWTQEGHDVYERLCRSCHGAAAEGSNVRSIPRLASQHYEYLLRQLHDSIEGRRPSMAGKHQTLSHLGMQELVGLADYLSRLTPPASQRDERTASIGRSRGPAIVELLTR
jgi:cytochrome c553